MTSKQIVLCTFGSLGDLYPIVALAVELKRRGHSPVVATGNAYRGLVESFGVEFHAVRPDGDPNDPDVLRKAMDPRTGGRYVVCEVIVPALRHTYEDTALVAKDADLVLVHPMALAAYLYVRKQNKLWASVAMAPVSMYSIYDPCVLPGIPGSEWIAQRGPNFQRFFLRTMAAMFEPLWKPYRAFEKELGLPAAPNPLFWGQSPHLALGLFSPVLAQKQRDWSPNAQATGFPFLETTQSLAPELEEFLQAGEPPIIFTLGSAAVGAAGDFFEQSLTAARYVGRRAVLLAGKNSAATMKFDTDCISVPYAPHSLVFPSACAIVHQGGIGTTGEAMRAGRPMLVVPYSHDQPDHAARLTRMGVAQAVPRNKYNAKTATSAIARLLNDRSYATRAAEIGGRVRNESGTVTACDLIEKTLAAEGNAR